MRIVYAGYDFFSTCLEHLCTCPDVEVVLCLTGRSSETVRNVERIATRHSLPLIYGRLGDEGIRRLNDLSVDLVICGAYSYRVPIERLTAKRAINIHPSLLPEGRGPNPLPRLVNGMKAHAGLTIHELTPRFDEGPVLVRREISVCDGDGFDALALKMMAVAPALLELCLNDFESYWTARQAQETGSYWPLYTEADRTIHAGVSTVRNIERLALTYGVLGAVLELRDGSKVEGTSFSCVACEHAFNAGSIVADLKTGLVIALVDGLVRVADPTWRHQ